MRPARRRGAPAAGVRGDRERARGAVDGRPGAHVAPADPRRVGARRHGEGAPHPRSGRRERDVVADVDAGIQPGVPHAGVAGRPVRQRAGSCPRRSLTTPGGRPGAVPAPARRPCRRRSAGRRRAARARCRGPRSTASRRRRGPRSGHGRGLPSVGDGDRHAGVVRNRGGRGGGHDVLRRARGGPRAARRRARRPRGRRAAEKAARGLIEGARLDVTHLQDDRDRQPR